ncbi:MAG TPA: GNAT family N-acetyltransferase [Phycisphaerales bacterium]|nr:GNAT family N-acetyltransferase [Phycisphaerales bacterium]
MTHHAATRAPGYLVSCDPSLLDCDELHRFLSTEAYWCLGLPRDVMERSLANSINFGVYDTHAPRGHEGIAGGSRAGDLPRLVGFARIVTDRATFAYLCDVYIIESYRGRGLSKFLMEAVLAHPDLQGLRRITLMTRDAHGLYEKFGFGYLDNPKRMMQLYIPDMYRSSPGRR